VDAGAPAALAAPTAIPSCLSGARVCWHCCWRLAAFAIIKIASTASRTRA